MLHDFDHLRVINFKKWILIKYIYRFKFDSLITKYEREKLGEYIENAELFLKEVIILFE
jgi:hypothetical protein